jgi:hypothetical protein
LPLDSDLNPGFDLVEEWLVDFDPTMSTELEAKSLSPSKKEVVLHVLEATAAYSDTRERSLAMAMDEAAMFLPSYRLLPVVSLSSPPVPRCSISVPPAAPTAYHWCNSSPHPTSLDFSDFVCDFSSVVFFCAGLARSCIPKDVEFIRVLALRGSMSSFADNVTEKQASNA